jgi:hypothetical protein
MTCWIAGWNLPGCLPEMEVAQFENEDDAWNFIEEEMDKYSDSNQDPDPYVYWVERCYEVLDEDKGVQNHG